MGHHYIPQYYLKGFADKTNTSQIWVYEKASEKVKFLPINNVAQACRYYSNEVEKNLANIEKEANKVLKKIRNLQLISSEEKIILSEYIATFRKRVPAAKKRYKKTIPQISDTIKQTIDFKLNNLKRKNPDKTDLIEKRREEAYNYIEKIKNNPRNDIWWEIIPPYKTPNIVKFTNKLNWTFLICDEPNIFLTNDNPIFIHESIGIRNKYSELVFPISSNIILWATKWGEDRKFIESNNQIIKKMNRRIVFNATRFVFCSKKLDWVKKLVMKKKYSN